MEKNMRRTTMGKKDIMNMFFDEQAWKILSMTNFRINVDKFPATGFICPSGESGETIKGVKGILLVSLSGDEIGALEKSMSDKAGKSISIIKSGATATFQGTILNIPAVAIIHKDKEVKA
jgi:hypothetical protein